MMTVRITASEEEIEITRYSFKSLQTSNRGSEVDNFLCLIAKYKLLI